MHESELGWFTSTDGRSIHYRTTTPDTPRAIVLVVHGYAEHSARYAHWMGHLADHGFASFAPDHRGHGRTGPVLGLVESLDDVLGDLAILHRRAIEAHPSLPVFLFGHSMGGLIGTLYASRTDDLAGVVLNGPALDIPDDTSPVLLAAGRILSRLAPRLGVQAFYDPAKLCRNPEVLADVEADPLFYKGWMRARTARELVVNIRSATRTLSQFVAPVLCTHGTDDEVVPPRTTDILIGGCASEDKTAHFFEGLLHEVHNEPVRDEVYAVWTDWLEARL